MDSLKIIGGNKLNGTIHISGAKNAALLASRMLALQDETVHAKGKSFIANQTDKGSQAGGEVSEEALGEQP